MTSWNVCDDSVKRGTVISQQELALWCRSTCLSPRERGCDRRSSPPPFERGSDSASHIASALESALLLLGRLDSALLVLGRMDSALLSLGRLESAVLLLGRLESALCHEVDWSQHFCHEVD